MIAINIQEASGPKVIKPEDIKKNSTQRSIKND